MSSAPCEVLEEWEFALARRRTFLARMGTEAPVCIFVTVRLRSQRRRASLERFDGRRSMVTVGADDSLCDRQPLTSNSFHSPSDGVYSSLIKTLAVVSSGSFLASARVRQCSLPRPPPAGDRLVA